MSEEQVPNTMEQGLGSQNQISAIRDILFGQNMKVYEEEFNRVRKFITDNRAEVEANMRVSNEQIMQTIGDLEQRLTMQMKKNHEELLAAIRKLEDDKLDRRQMGKLLGDIGTHIAL